MKLYVPWRMHGLPLDTGIYKLPEEFIHGFTTIKAAHKYADENFYDGEKLAIIEADCELDGYAIVSDTEYLIRECPKEKINFYGFYTAGPRCR